MDKYEWQKMFKDNKFVDNYKTGEKVTGKFAQSLLEQSGMVKYANSSPEKSLVVLDNACGTGVVSSLLNQQLSEKVKKNWNLTCGDITEGMLAYTRNRLQHEDWQNVEVKNVDAQETGLPSAHYTHAITAFAYMALPKSLEALDETSRILQPGGTIAFSTWIEPGWITIVQKALETIPESLPFPTTEEFLAHSGRVEWNSVPWIESQLKQRGFEKIIVKADTKTISLPGPEFVEMAMIMFPVITKSFWTEKQREDHGDKVRPALEKYLEQRYGKDEDVPMEWTAILSTACKPN
ncbi:hypothetical protein N7448_001626 [Penicillium atrosanguineum]|uniref:Methyltransferase domain-containing protein n=1 Tax=Penicillium atrosanguineum TaxID=1132637 RepID=A0A9W9U8F9_9EURO|nr:uncharacterized protein N7443_005024 [Penicillium atrosanguineum]KAJ5133345.1 hypothetical protein N7526_004710 [Penicillium atrosanguineum]KAJ5150048.1 hypothetical protein N7448_001626 [Penicillium atrosanguineum]KAJ5305364.1 hypothetical protein N7443_005024 [Penicillium atrosanguineum]KAJ5324826.1 hypothetical protein N7476_003426 [Penicillium atrosanguineum]